MKQPISITHNLNAYKDGQKWITYCKLCGLEGDELFGVHCTGKVEPVICITDTRPQDLDNIIKNDVDKSNIDAYYANHINERY